MKKNNFILAALSFTLLIGLTTFLIGSKKTNDVVIEEKQNPEIISGTVSYPIPESIEFCGSRIPLDRLDMYERFDREINSFCYFHSTTLMYFKRANRYFPIIEPILKKNEIPDDFKYLSVIESNLDTRALSPAKAAGLWQFMEATGKSFGLEITAEVDERYHIEKATEAACKYLKQAYRRYGNWADVAASYNAGVGRISSEMTNQMVDSAFDLLLVSETSRYVFRILAIKEIFENPRKYGFILKKENLYSYVPVHSVTITSDIENMALFAKENGINYMQLKEFNVWLRDTKLRVNKGRTYQIDIPAKEDLYRDANKIKVHNEAWVL